VDGGVGGVRALAGRTIVEAVFGKAASDWALLGYTVGGAAAGQLPVSY
jgi:hypothetical protein